MCSLGTLLLVQLREGAKNIPRGGCSKNGGGHPLSPKMAGVLMNLVHFGGEEMTLHYFGGSVDDMLSFWGG